MKKIAFLLCLLLTACGQRGNDKPEVIQDPILTLEMQDICSGVITAEEALTLLPPGNTPLRLPADDEWEVGDNITCTFGYGPRAYGELAFSSDVLSGPTQEFWYEDKTNTVLPRENSFIRIKDGVSEDGSPFIFADILLPSSYFLEFSIEVPRVTQELVDYAFVVCQRIAVRMRGFNGTGYPGSTLEPLPRFPQSTTEPAAEAKKLTDD